MFQKILIPLDGSPAAEEAFAYLENFPGCRVVLGRVSTAPYHVGFYGEYPVPTEVFEVEKEACGDYLEGAKKKLGRDDVRTEVMVGEPSEEILGLAERESCDLILMTSHGRSGVERWLLGSIAERVSRHAHCPVLIVGRNFTRSRKA